MLFKSFLIKLRLLVFSVYSIVNHKTVIASAHLKEENN